MEVANHMDTVNPYSECRYCGKAHDFEVACADVGPSFIGRCIKCETSVWQGANALKGNGGYMTDDGPIHIFCDERIR